MGKFCTLKATKTDVYTSARDLGVETNQKTKELPIKIVTNIQKVNINLSDVGFSIFKFGMMIYERYKESS